MSIMEIDSISKLRKEIKAKLLLELSESEEIPVLQSAWSPNVGPLVDLCAAATKFNESRNMSECERHRFIKVLSKSIQLLNLVATKSSEDHVLISLEELILESAELYADIEVNKGDKNNG